MRYTTSQKTHKVYQQNPLENMLSIEGFIHSVNVAEISLKIGEMLLLDEEEKQFLYECAIFHDIGKSRIPKHILFKTGKLSPEEWKVMKEHSIYSQEIYMEARGKYLPQGREVAQVIRGHHENWDGSGYPDGLRGEEISIYHRVLRIADVFDAITQPRLYRPFKVRNAIEILKSMAGKELDPQLLEQCIPLLEKLLEHRVNENAENWCLEQEKL